MDIRVSSSSFFNAGVCHYCKRVPRDGSSSDSCSIKIFACAGCRFFFYCGKECQKRDRPNHKHFCNAASTLRSEKPGLFQDQILGSEDRWVNYRRELMTIFSEKMYKKLGRGISTIEKHAFTHMRACFICYRVNCDLYTCGDCYSVFHCEGHHMNQKNHGGCAQFALTLSCDQLVHARGLTPVQVPVGRCASYTPLPSSWSAYLRQRPFSTAADFRAMSKSEKVVKLSHLSFPLTILFLLERLPRELPVENTESLNLHIVGAAGSPDIAPSVKYEELFHLLPNLRKLDLWMVGPSVPNQLVHTQNDIQVCSACEEVGCQATMHYHKQVYHEFMETENFSVPDLAIAFNAGLHEHLVNKQETWTASLKRMAEASIPCAFTSYNREECRVDAQSFTTSGGSVTVEPVVNPFRSLRPHREGFNLGYFYSWNSCLFASGPVLKDADTLVSVKERTDENERLLVKR